MKNRKNITENFQRVVVISTLASAFLICVFIFTACAGTGLSISPAADTEFFVNDDDYHPEETVDDIVDEGIEQQSGGLQPPIEALEDNEYNTVENDDICIPDPPENYVSIEPGTLTINEKMFEWLDKTPEELEKLAGSYIETVWYCGLSYRFGNHWFRFSESNSKEIGYEAEWDEYKPLGTSVLLEIMSLNEIVLGIPDNVYIHVFELDALFGQEKIVCKEWYDTNVYTDPQGVQLLDAIAYEYKGVFVAIETNIAVYGDYIYSNSYVCLVSY